MLSYIDKGMSGMSHGMQMRVEVLADSGSSVSILSFNMAIQPKLAVEEPGNA